MKRQEIEDMLDMWRTECNAKTVARAMVEEATKYCATEEEVKLACELALATYREGAEAYRQFFEKISSTIDAALAARKGEKKPPTREGERLERLLNTDLEPRDVWVTLVVQSDTAKETCKARLTAEQAETLMEQLDGM